MRLLPLYGAAHVLIHVMLFEVLRLLLVCVYVLFRARAQLEDGALLLWLLVLAPVAAAQLLVGPRIELCGDSLQLLGPRVVLGRAFVPLAGLGTLL